MNSLAWDCNYCKSSMMVFDIPCGNEEGTSEAATSGNTSLTFSECKMNIGAYITFGSCTEGGNFIFPVVEWTWTGGTDLDISGGLTSASISPAVSLSSLQPGSVTLTARDSEGNSISGTLSYGVECYWSCVSCDDEGDGNDNPAVGTASTQNGSVSAFIRLGRGAFGKKLGGLVLHEKTPMTELCTPKCLKAPFATNKYCQIITNDNGIRQAKVTEGLADVITNTPYKYTINVYPEIGCGTTNAEGIYQTAGPTIASIVVENPDTSGATTNRLKITDGEGLISEYEHSVNGWELIKAGGVSKEIKTFGWTESNTLRTTTNEMRNSTNGLVSMRKTKYKIYDFGQRLIESVTGDGSEALTNSYTWYTNSGNYTTGLLRQVIDPAGKWAVFEYNTNKLKTNETMAFLNQVPTSNGSLARRVEYTYGSNVIAGAGDRGAYSPFQPRRTVEYVLDREVARSYMTFKRGESRNIQCVTANAAWNSADNLITTTRYYTTGTNTGRDWTIERPDGTLEVRDYHTATNQLYRTNITMFGAPDAYKTNVVDGAKTVSVRGHVGQQLSRTVIDIASGITNSHEVYSDFDDRNRAKKVTYLDGTFTWTDYGCCGAINSTNRQGTTFKNHRDALNRHAAKQNVNLSLTTTNVYDAGQNLLRRIRIGSDGSKITNVTHTYDTAGRILSSRDALGNTTTFSESISNSQLTRTTTYPDGGTRIEEYYRDGQLAKVTGTAVNPVRYEYGVEEDDGAWRLFTKEIKLDAGGSDTAEWIKTFKDMVGRPYKVLYADAATRERFYNITGQFVKEVDSDGVTMLFAYNSQGELEYSATDLNRNGTIDFNGTDRITLTVRAVTSHNGYNVQQTRTYAWSTNNSSVSNLIATTEINTEGLRSWRNSFSLTNSIQRVFAGTGNHYETNTAPDGSSTIDHSQYGQILSTTRRDALGTQLGRTTFAYDAHGRMSALSDARNGTTARTYDAADRVISTRTPIPGNGQNAQVTTFNYDWVGRVTQTTLPDSAVVYNVYSTSGKLLTNYGARTYPVSYSYDPQGRRTNMVTWTNFAARGGAASTAWKFDSLRGFMTNIVYADGNGPSYTYTAGGRLRTRKWARGITTTYETNAAADVVGITYSDGTTSNVTYNLDRLGRRTNILDGAGTRLLSYTSFGSLSLETNTTGVLAGTAIEYQFDHLHRRTNLAIHTPGTAINHAYSFATASRLSNVSDGTYNAAYDYLANSPLVSQITYRSNSAVRMTTTKKYDHLNRLLDISSVPSASSVVKFAYQYNDANQRVRRTDSDASYWSYEYDPLGQVASGKHYWPDGPPFAGQQFEYTYDDIGNRRRTKEGGDAAGAGLRTTHYTVNNLNQYTQRDVPGAADITGIAHPNSSVTVNDQSVYRHGEYYHKELAIDNSAAPIWQAITNQAIYSGQTNTTNGNILLPRNPQSFWHDTDGNTLSDYVGTNSWDGENRMTLTENTLAVPSAGRAKEAWTFDAEGRWVQRVLHSWTGSAYAPQATNRFLWDSKVLVAMMDHNSILVSLLRGFDVSGSLQGAGGVGGLIAASTPTNGVHFCAYDGNGNVMALANAADGLISGTYQFDPFGSHLRVTGTAGKANPVRFSTQFANDFAGVLKYLYRDYLGSSGRWRTRDSVAEQGFILVTGLGRPSRALHPYSWVANSPILDWDYLGLDNPGCDIPWYLGWMVGGDSDCQLNCCAIHDKGYYNHSPRCTAASWFTTCIIGSGCGKHNREALACFAKCAMGCDPGNPPSWFCANGADANTTFYNWNNIPDDCWENGVKP